MRSGFADRFRFVGSVNSVALLAQTHPARANRIARPRKDGLTAVVIDGVGNPAFDSEGPNRTWRRRPANRHAVDLLDLAVFDEAQLSVLDTNHDRPLLHPSGRGLSLGTPVRNALR
jgi:hypothetical protein